MSATASESSSSAAGLTNRNREYFTSAFQRLVALEEKRVETAERAKAIREAMNEIKSKIKAAMIKTRSSEVIIDGLGAAQLFQNLKPPLAKPTRARALEGIERGWQGRDLITFLYETELPLPTGDEALVLKFKASRKPVMRKQAHLVPAFQDADAMQED